MAEVAWKDDFLSGAEQRALLQRQLTMGARHLDLGLEKTLWTHMCVDHMYAYVARWGTIAPPKHTTIQFKKMMGWVGEKTGFENAERAILGTMWHK